MRFSLWLSQPNQAFISSPNMKVNMFMSGGGHLLQCNSSYAAYLIPHNQSSVSKMKWFGNTWESSDHTFPGNERHPPTTCIMHSKMNEKSRQSEEALATMYDYPCTAWATYLCQPKGHPGEIKYVMKIYIQYVTSVYSTEKLTKHWILT